MEGVNCIHYLGALSCAELYLRRIHVLVPTCFVMTSFQIIERDRAAWKELYQSKLVEIHEHLQKPILQFFIFSKRKIRKHKNSSYVHNFGRM